VGTIAGLLDCRRSRLRSFEGSVRVASDCNEFEDRDCSDDDGGGARLAMRDDERGLREGSRVDDIGIGAIAPHNSVVARRQGVDAACRLRCGCAEGGVCLPVGW
jgi:hypothetical protein